MGKIEEVARYLHQMIVRFASEYGETSPPKLWGKLRQTAKDHYLNEAKQICQLFEPKPNEDRLLTEPDEVQVKLSTDDLEPDELDVAYRRGYEEGTINQDIKTASIKDAECQARVERMLEEKEKA